MIEGVLPSDAELERLAEQVLAPLLDTESICVVERKRLGQGSFPKEVLTLSDGERRIQLLCKYEGGFEHSAQGHRGGVGYEALVYEQVLGPGGFSTANVLLVHRPPERPDTWLFLEFLSGAVRVSKAPGQDAMADAAAWIGRFHARTAGMDAPAFMKRYDREYYIGWLRRTDVHVQDGGGVGTWWPEVLRRFEEHLHVLAELEPSLVHGEFYPKNVLWSAGRVSPVDWETAAVGAGVIDLVSLIDGWPASMDRCCTDAYIRARWPHGPSAWFSEQRSLAEMYLHFRWLGEEGNPAQRSKKDPREWRRVQRIEELATEGLGWL